MRVIGTWMYYIVLGRAFGEDGPHPGVESVHLHDKSSGSGCPRMGVEVKWALRSWKVVATLDVQVKERCQRSCQRTVIMGETSIQVGESLRDPGVGQSTTALTFSRSMLMFTAAMMYPRKVVEAQENSAFMKGW